MRLLTRTLSDREALVIGWVAMTKIPHLTIDDAPEGSKRLLSKLPSLNVFSVLAHSPAALDGFVRMGSNLLYKGSLDPVLRELVILRVAHLSGAAYEVAHHEDAARQLGVSQEKIQGTQSAVIAPGHPGSLYEEEVCAALHYAEEVVERVKATEETWARVASHFDHAQQVELTLTIGYYMMVARFLENMEIGIEPEGTEGLDFSDQS